MTIKACSSVQDRMKYLKIIEEKIKDCRTCPLNQEPNDPGLAVPGFGSLDAKLMIIGEAPGYWESKQGLPFVGKSGQILQEALSEVPVKIKDLFITNVIKHRPPNNRDPMQFESDICISYLTKQIELVNPKQIICVGKVSAIALARNSEINLPSSGLRGKSFIFKNRWPVTITWHPAYVMRNPNKRPELLEDLRNAYNR